jgi:hypothetical protein
LTTTIKVTAGSQTLNGLQLHLPDYVEALLDTHYPNTPLLVDELKANKSHTFSFKLQDNFSNPLTDEQLKALETNQDASGHPVIYFTGANLASAADGISVVAGNQQEARLTGGEINENSVDRSTEITLTNDTAHTISIDAINNSKDTIIAITDIPNGCGSSLAVNSRCQIKLAASEALDDSNISQYVNNTKVNYTPQGSQPAQVSAETTVHTLTRIGLSGQTTGIEKPTDGSTKTESITLTNKGPFSWQPSTAIGDYTLNSDETPLPAWNTQASVSSC